MATGFVTHVRLLLLLFVSMTMSVCSTIADMLYRVRPTPMSSHSLPPAHLHRQCQVSDRKRTANGSGLGVYVGFMTHVRLPHDATHPQWFTHFTLPDFKLGTNFDLIWISRTIHCCAAVGKILSDSSRRDAHTLRCYIIKMLLSLICRIRR